MDRSEWEVVRDVDRKLRFISKTCAQIEKNKADISSLQTEFEDIREIIEDYKKILKMRRRIQTGLKWIITLALTASITTIVNFQVNYLMNRDETKQAPTRPEISTKH